MPRRMTVLVEVPDDWTAEDLETVLANGLANAIDGADVTVAEVHADDLTEREG